MKKLFLVACCLLTVAIVLWLVGCSKDEGTSTSPQLFGINKLAPKSPTDQHNCPDGYKWDNQTQQCVPQPGGGANGTTLGSTVTITCFDYYPWTLGTPSNPGDFILCPSDPCQPGTVTVSVTKGNVISGFSGQVCVTNGGAVATTDLKVTVELWSGLQSGFTTKEAGPIDITSTGSAIIAAGGNSCYSYTFNVPIDPSKHYKVESFVTITNHSGHLGTAFGPSTDSPSLDGCPPCDVSVAISAADSPVYPEWGVTVSGSPQTVSASGTVTFGLNICDLSAPYDSGFVDNFAVTLTGQCNQGSGSVTFYKRNPCQPPPPGCSLTIGYWKTHAVANLFGHNPDRVSDKLPISLGDGGPKTIIVSANTQVVSIMEKVGPGGSSNGILKLYAQLLGAKLSIASTLVPDHSCVDATIAAADAFLGTHNADDWASLSKDDRNNVLGWMSTLDNYNNGLLCAPHCQ